MDRYWWAPDSGCILASVGHRCGCIGFTEAAPSSSLTGGSTLEEMNLFEYITKAGDEVLFLASVSVLDAATGAESTEPDSPSRT